MVGVHESDMVVVRRIIDKEFDRLARELKMQTQTLQEYITEITQKLAKLEDEVIELNSKVDYLETRMSGVERRENEAFWMGQVND